MFIETFQGYNCYSSAIGEAASSEVKNNIHNVVLSQWTYFFDKEKLLDGQWYTGAADGPVDKWLLEDLKKYSNIAVEVCTSTESEVLNESREYLKEFGNQIILVDFSYLNSFNWKSLSRFNVFPQHDPHFVILTELTDEGASIIDPFYHHKEVMSISDFIASRNDVTKQGKLEFESYRIIWNEMRETDIRELLHKRFERFLTERMYHAIEAFAMAIHEVSEENMGREWAFAGYNCLNSTVYQHQNLMHLKKLYNLELPFELGDMIEDWANIRKKLFEFYNLKQSNKSLIIKSLLEMELKERTFAEKVYQCI